MLQCFLPGFLSTEHYCSIVITLFIRLPPLTEDERKASLPLLDQEKRRRQIASSSSSFSRSVFPPACMQCRSGASITAAIARAGSGRSGGGVNLISLPYLSSNTYAYVHKTLLGTYIWVGLGLYGAVLTQGTNCEPIIFHRQKFTRLQVPPPSPPRPRTSQGDRNPQGASDDDSANIPDSRGISSSCRFQSQFRVFVFPF